MVFLHLWDTQYNVGLRITRFLELDNVNPGNASAKNAILPKVTDKSIEVLSQHARYQVRHIQGGLTCPKFAGYLWLLWVASHRNKIGILAILSHNDHSILIALLDIDWQAMAR